LTLLSTLQHWWAGNRWVQNFAHHTDMQLLELFQAGQQASILDALIARHGDALYHFLLSLSDALIAEDISQQTWLKLVEQPERFSEHNASFRTWLFTVGRNAVVDELRRQNRWQLQDINEADSNIDPNLDTEESLLQELFFDDSEDIHERFDAALLSLSFVQKEALMLQLEGFSLDDIASITFEKPETIKSRLRFARKALKKEMEVPYD
jgi:RNA polymerase sigma factor (sigma-70 family)